MKPSIRLVASATALALAALTAPVCAQNAAIVNGKAIPKAKLDEFVAAMVREGRPDTPEMRTAIREELIARELFAQEAERKGLARHSDTRAQLEQARQDILIRAAIRDHLKNNPVTEAQIKAEYDKLVGAAGGNDKEYRARHILVETEAEAKGVIEALRKGGKFEELAAKQSKDPGSKNNGGDLDWNGASVFVKPFSEAMVKLEKGQVTEIPVQTEFGWHVIRLDDVRVQAPPPLEQVAPQIKQELDRRNIQNLQQSLRAKAKIQ